MIPVGVNIAMLRRTNWRPLVWQKRNLSYGMLMKSEILPTRFKVMPDQWQQHFIIYDARRINAVSYKMSHRGGDR